MNEPSEFTTWWSDVEAAHAREFAVAQNQAAFLRDTARRAWEACEVNRKSMPKKVKEPKLVGDGKTDNSETIKFLLDRDGYVHLPAGEYRFTKPVGIGHKQRLIGSKPQ